MIANTVEVDPSDRVDPLDRTVEELVAQRPKTLSEIDTHYCPGCMHGVAHRLVAEVIDELNIRERTIGVAPVGCSVFAYNYFECDFAVAAHGRAPAMATGLKRVMPDKVIFTYQGDGDLASIGSAEILHAAARGENITVVFVNNAVYGMTGGQMAPTTLVGMKTTSSPYGRDLKMSGAPLKMSELIAQIDGVAFVSRRSLHSPAEIRKAKKAIRRAFEMQLNGQGFSMVELLSSCPTNWDMKPVEALRWIETRMVPVFPLGDFKNSVPKNSVRGV
ncbi:MAG: thiamine pyrophosphate-dependent enzyme [Chloroflexi bacterium]|nr:thiamine pyrophosphate-dependent enzyme [Chloroflexota bacterium]